MLTRTPQIWHLTMSAKRKLSLTGVFLVGLMSLAASIARMAIYLIVLYDGYSAGYDINRESSYMPQDAHT